jgi:hypothetical protein
MLTVDGNGKIVFTFYYSGNVFTLSPLSILTVNTWYFVTVVHNKGTISCYLNGILIAGRGDNNNKFAYSGNVFIGKSNQNSQFFNGTVDEVRIDHSIEAQTGLKQNTTINRHLLRFIPLLRKKKILCKCCQVQSLTVVKMIYGRIPLIGIPGRLLKII